MFFDEIFIGLTQLQMLLSDNQIFLFRSFSHVNFESIYFHIVFVERSRAYVSHLSSSTAICCLHLHEVSIEGVYWIFFPFFHQKLHSGLHIFINDSSLLTLLFLSCCWERNNTNLKIKCTLHYAPELA